MPIIAPDETLIKKLHPSRWHFWEFYFFGLLLFFAGIFIFVSGYDIEVRFLAVQIPQVSGWLVFLFFAFGIASFLIVELLRIFHIYYITDKRIVQEFIFLSRRVTSCYYDQIQNINSVQSILDRIVSIGNLEFHTAGWGGSNKPEICFLGVFEPVLLKNLIIQTKLKSENK